MKQKILLLLVKTGFITTLPAQKNEKNRSQQPGMLSPLPKKVAEAGGE